MSGFRTLMYETGKVSAALSARRSVQPWNLLTATKRGASQKSSCTRPENRRELDMESLLWTRGRAFPLSWLEMRLRGSRAVSHALAIIRDKVSSVAP